MSGVAIIRGLLVANSGVTTVVPTTRIMAGNLPLNTALPAIEIAQISSIPRNSIRINESPKVHSDRVQVTALFKDIDGGGYAGVKSLLKLVLAACPSQRGTINSFECISIAPDIEQVGAADEGTNLISGSRDFIVVWNSTVGR